MGIAIDYKGDEDEEELEYNKKEEYMKEMLENGYKSETQTRPTKTPYIDWLHHKSSNSKVKDGRQLVKGGDYY